VRPAFFVVSGIVVHSAKLFVTVRIDGEKKWKGDVVDKNISPKWIMKDPIRL
jgi:hypothetical protein